ncbi:MAG: preprotein translocase subunit SecE [Firmicutes bacterium]|nr:preprotein translocase subunit SecE [Bacillota bacterium]
MRWLREVPGRIGRYLREVRVELKKVVWPDRRQTIIYTGVVLASVVVVALVIWVVDAVLSVGLRALLLGGGS